MTKDEIIETLRAILKNTSREKVNWDAVTTENTIASLGFDSLSILDLMYDIQQEFQIEFEAEEMIHIKTVGDLVAWLEAKTKE